jgi:hypothetical protein
VGATATRKKSAPLYSSAIHICGIIHKKSPQKYTVIAKCDSYVPARMGPMSGETNMLATKGK